MPSAFVDGGPISADICCGTGTIGLYLAKVSTPLRHSLDQ